MSYRCATSPANNELCRRRNRQRRGTRTSWHLSILCRSGIGLRERLGLRAVAGFGPLSSTQGGASVLAGASFSGDHGGAQALSAPSIATPIRNSAQCRPEIRSVKFDLRKRPQTTFRGPERRANAKCQPPGCDPAGVKTHLCRNQRSALAQRARRVRQLERRADLA